MGAREGGVNVKMPEGFREITYEQFESLTNEFRLRSRAIAKAVSQPTTANAVAFNVRPDHYFSSVEGKGFYRKSDVKFKKTIGYHNIWHFTTTPCFRLKDGINKVECIGKFYVLNTATMIHFVGEHTVGMCPWKRYWKFARHYDYLIRGKR